MNTKELRLESSPAEEGVSKSSGRSFRFPPPLLLLVDLLLGAVAYGGAWLVRIYVRIPVTQDLLPQERWDVVEHSWLLLVISQVFFPYIFGLYDDLRILRRREILAQTFTACTIQVIALASVFYLTNGIFPRTVILIFGLFNFIGLLAFRLLLKSRLSSQLLNVLVVAEDHRAAREIVREIRNNPWMGMHILGVITDSRPDSESQEKTYEVLGGSADTQKVAASHPVDEIIFASRNTWRDDVLNSLSRFHPDRPLRISIQPSLYELAIGRLRHFNLYDMPLIEVRGNPSEPFHRFVKRSLDLLVSVAGLILTLPFFPFIAALIFVDSPGQIFFTQERIGLKGKVFRVIKFRTMIPDAERDSGEKYAEENDPRVTRVGRILRRFRIDELPQLINVLKGDMSLVGPRPERPGFVARLSEELTGYGERHKVKPGITGLAQVRGYYDTAADKKLKYDLAYIYNYSLSLDLMVILETIKTILTRRGS